MTFYCYALYDNIDAEFSLVQSHPNDDIALYEFVRQILSVVINGDLHNLTVDSSVNPFVWSDGSFELNYDFFARFSLFRIGIFDTSSGLLDGSVEKVNLSNRFLEVAKSYLEYCNSLEYFKELEVNGNEG